MRIIIGIAVLLLALLAVMFYPGMTGNTATEELVYLQDGRVFKKNEIDFLLAEFNKKGIANTSQSNGKIQIPKSYRTKCNEIVRSTDFERLSKKGSSDNSLSNPFISPTAKDQIAQKEKLRNLESILARISGIREAVIVHDQAKSQGFNRKTIHTAFVTLWAKEGQVISQLHASTARKMVKQSFADMTEKDVLVVDGDTGLTFSLEYETSTDAQIVESQVDLETTRQEFEIQCKKLISHFGQSQVTVRMDLEKRTVALPSPKKPMGPKGKQNADSSEVVANGKGEISARTIEEPKPLESPTHKTVLIKRLFGIDVSIEKRAVEEYVRQNLGVTDDISDEQFTRGIVSVRNEITKAIVLWLRSQQGIDVNSDVVSVAVVTGDIEQESAETISAAQVDSFSAYAISAAVLILVMTLFVMATLKSRSPIDRSQNQSDRVSPDGRTMENRTTDSVDSVSAESPAQPTPESSNAARQFPNMLPSEAS